jgi:transposase
MPVELPDGRSLSNEVLEALRLRAIRARQFGYTLQEISGILGIALETVCRWCSAYEEGGQDALPGDRTGRPVGSGRTLSDEQAEKIQQLIDHHCPDELGIPSALWTRKAVRELIEKEFGIRMPLRTVGEYLRRWNYTPQRPARKSYKQDPKEVQEWLEKKYPEIEERAKAEHGEIHWGDEAGVRSTCHGGRGYARKGHTPVLKLPGNRFSVNMISTVTNQGKLRFMIYTGRMNASLFLIFLGRLVRNAEKKVFLIVDNLRVHEAAEVKEWLTGKEEQIEIFYLPKYAPELNPDEYLNCDVKGNVNEQGLPQSREDLKSRVKNFMHRLAKLPERIASYFQHPCIQYACADPRET